ncbi:hypothetical protein K438DRAFT_1849884 [Mycena galopus ATCC 62051]|nr:hypothetical protein K438DRAFT_1849884 [Mycena galopus ATCC 62051]
MSDEDSRQEDSDSSHPEVTENELDSDGWEDEEPGSSESSNDSEDNRQEDSDSSHPEVTVENELDSDGWEDEESESSESSNDSESSGSDAESVSDNADHESLSSQPEAPLTIPASWQQIYSSQIEEVQGTVLDLSLHATPRRYRLFDCKPFVEENKLIIYESADLPDVPYTAISYTWRGNETNIDDPSSPLYWKDALGTFQAKGGEDGDPISLDVLHHACILSLRASSRFLWFDRLCIMQTSKPDKVWQISKMNAIYKHCKICCILPGGIRRLVRLTEETSWIHRGWTLQEAIVPKHATVLFAWDRAMDGKRISVSSATALFQPCDVIPGQSAEHNLHGLLQSAFGGIDFRIDSVRIPVEIHIFGESKFPYAALMDALETDYTLPYPDRKQQCIWRSALLRTSSRPVDMVFSIMDIFGVSLDPRSFQPDDRLGATIALARAILENGGTASWIGATYQLDPCPELSTFPQFPETSVAGKAYLRASDGSRKEVVAVMSDRIRRDQYLAKSSGGSMDDEGYLTMRIRAARVSQIPQNSPSAEKTIALPAADGSVWSIHDVKTSVPPSGPVTYLLYIGESTQSSNPAFGRYEQVDPLKGWIVQEHAPNKFHRVTYLNILKTYGAWIEKFPKMSLSIGGPNPAIFAVEPPIKTGLV